MSDNGSSPEPPESSPPVETPAAQTPPDRGKAPRSKVKKPGEARAVTATKAGT